MELLLLLIPFFFAGGDKSTPTPTPTPADVELPTHTVRTVLQDDGTWRYEIFAGDNLVHSDGPFATQAAARTAAANWGAQQGGAAPEEPPEDVPVVCTMIVTVEADGREATLCKQLGQQGAQWRIFRNADELLPHGYADPGKAAQRVIMMLQANTAQNITIRTPNAIARIQRIQQNLYKWRVTSSSSQGGGIGVSSMSEGTEATLLDAMGAAYEAAGGL